jgi:hypothetical protein
MSPEELAKYRAEKLQKAEMDKAEKKAAETAARESQQARAEAARKGLTTVVIPYFDELVKGLPGFSYTTMNEATSGEVLGVDFIVDNRAARIQLAGSAVNAATRDHRQGGMSRFTFINSADDLTREKVGHMIKAMIDEG